MLTITTFYIYIMLIHLCIDIVLCCVVLHYRRVHWLHQPMLSPEGYVKQTAPRLYNSSSPKFESAISLGTYDRLVVRAKRVHVGTYLEGLFKVPGFNVPHANGAIV
jgi:hypothetical protein